MSGYPDEIDISGWSDQAKRDLIAECREIFGDLAAQQLTDKLKLPPVRVLHRCPTSATSASRSPATRRS